MGAREDHAKSIIAKELGVVVKPHDDGTRQGAYDLRVGPVAAPRIAIECTSAHDEDLTKLSRTMARWGRFELSLDGDWDVRFHREAASVLREVKEQIEVGLRMCEQRGEYDFYVDHRLEGRQPDLFTFLSGLHVASALCVRRQGHGHVYLNHSGIGTIVDEMGALLPGWIEDFLHDPKQEPT